MNNKIKWLIPITFLILTALSCTDKESSQEAQKLLERQAQVEKREKKTKKVLKEVQILRDSLTKEQIELQEKKEKLKTDLEELKTKNENLSDQSKEQKFKELSQQIEALENQFNAITKNLGDLQNKDHQKSGIDIQDEHITKKDKPSYYQLVTGIKFIDSSLIELKRQSMLKQNEIILYEQTLALALKKIELFEDEKNSIQRTKNEIIRHKEADSKLEKYDRRIVELEKLILGENIKITDYKENIHNLKRWILDANELYAGLESLLEKEYQKNKTIAKFVKDEFAQLNKENDAELSFVKEHTVSHPDAGSENLDKAGTDANDQISDNKTTQEVPEIAQNQHDSVEKKTIPAEKRIIDSFPITKDLSELKLSEEDEKEITEQENALNKKDTTDLRELTKSDSQSANGFTRVFLILIFIAVLIFIVLYTLGKKKLNKDV